MATPHPGRFTTGRRSGNHCTVGWVGPRGGLNRCRKSRLPPPTGIRSPDRPARSESIYWPRYPGPPLIINTYTVTLARVRCRCLAVMRTPPPLLLLCAPSIKQPLTDVDTKVTGRSGGSQPVGCTPCPVRQSCVLRAAVLTGPFWSKEYIRSGTSARSQTRSPYPGTSIIPATIVW